MGRRTKEENDFYEKLGCFIVVIVMVPALAVFVLILMLVFRVIEP